MAEDDRGALRDPVAWLLVVAVALTLWRASTGRGAGAPVPVIALRVALVVGFAVALYTWLRARRR